MPDSNWIAARAAQSIDPQRVAITLQKIAFGWPPDAIPFERFIAEFPLGGDSLLHLISVSSICAGRFSRDPTLLIWLAQPGIADETRTARRMAAELHRRGGEIAANGFRALRQWKAREMTRIALREVAGVAELEETTAELSHLAEVCLVEVFKYWNQTLRARLGSPSTEFAVLGLGKLGGGELNHSSDIDVIFVYGEEGNVNARIANHEWFNRLGEKIIETFSASHPEGSLFRIDLRLRPEGAAGPLARSLDSMEHYYGGFGETWERLALIKARSVCGDHELGYEFVRQLQPFIYPRSATPDLLDEIAAIKRRIERDVVGHENVGRDVKLGAGGIREIEFIVQALQFTHGARHAFLQEPSTLRALRGLARLDLLPRGEVAQLDGAYRFLRRVEHRLQIEAEEQTHTIPNDRSRAAILSASLGFPDAAHFNSELQNHMHGVRSIFERVVESAPRTTAAENTKFFSDEPRATRELLALTQGSAAFHVAPRTRQVFRKLRPLLLAEFARCADADAALTHFVRFVEAYGLRSFLFELLVSNPRLLELLVRTFDVSIFAASILIRRPQLLDELTRSETLHRPIDRDEHLVRLGKLSANAINLDGVRQYRQAQLVRIIFRDVLGELEFDALVAEQTALAEACVVFVNRVLGGNALTIIALGKFGGSEIAYGADLDVLFVGDDYRAAQNLVAVLARPRADGLIATLDARLRPDGEKGPLVISLDAYASYYRERAQFWELQALSRARCIDGGSCGDFIETVRPFWRQAGQRSDVFASISAMLRRIHDERTSGDEFRDFKTGAGGLAVFEFTIQALQMRADIWEPNTLRAAAALRDAKVIVTDDYEVAVSAYRFLRSCESALRRFDNKSVDRLPSTENEQHQLAIRLGIAARALCVDRYTASREALNRFYEKYLSAPASAP